MNVGTLGLLFTLCVFGAIGWRLAHKRSRPAGVLTFVGLLVGALIGQAVSEGTRLLDVDGFAVRLNWAIVACCLGAFLGVLARNRALRQLRSA